MIDWDRSSTKILGLDDAITHVFVIDKEGFLRFKLAGRYSEEGLNKVMEQVEKLR